MPQKFLSLKNFEKYQTYKHSNPPWFKIHKSIFGDREFSRMSTASRFLYIGLIHLAVESNNKVYNDQTWIAQRLYIDRTEVNLTPLYKAGFLICANVRREVSVQDSTGQISTGQDRAHAEDAHEEFEVFWKSYPKKVDKERARKAWGKLNDSRPEIARLLEAIERQKQSEQWMKNGGTFIPYPTTWLNGKRWEDQVHPVQHQPSSLVELL